jgi:hypothetical protein
MDTTSPNSATSTWTKLRVAAKKDPKKAGALVVLVAVMGGMWAKTLLQQQPASAAAGIASLTPAADPLTPASSQSPTSNKDRTISSGRPAWSSVNLAPATRNLFRIDFERYERFGKNENPAATTQQSGISNDPAKSGPSPADLKKERQILAANLQSQAAQLRLQTTVMGAEPRALVNGNLVGEGDMVASFRVMKITARGMVIEREGIRLEIQMKRSTDAMP